MAGTWDSTEQTNYDVTPNVRHAAIVAALNAP